MVDAVKYVDCMESKLLIGVKARASNRPAGKQAVVRA